MPIRYSDLTDEVVVDGERMTAKQALDKHQEALEKANMRALYLRNKKMLDYIIGAGKPVTVTEIMNALGAETWGDISKDVNNCIRSELVKKFKRFNEGYFMLTPVGYSLIEKAVDAEEGQ